MGRTCFKGNDRLVSESIWKFRHLMELNMEEQGNKPEIGRQVSCI